MQQIIEDLIKRVELLENRLNLKSFEQLRKEVGQRACRYINWIEVPYDAFVIKKPDTISILKNISENKMIITSDFKYMIIHNDCKHLIDFNLFLEVRGF